MAGLRRRLLPLLLFLAVAGTYQAQVPLPAPGGRSVHDRAGVLSPSAASSLESLHRQLFERTGVAITTVTVPSLDGEPIADFALRVGEEWGLGRKGEDRGIVVALALEERDIFVATGYGVEGFLPDGRIGRFIDQYALPSFKQGDFSAGLLRLSQGLAAASAQEFGVTLDGVTVQPPRGRGESQLPAPLRILFGLIFFAVMAYLAIRHPTLFFLLLLSARGGRGGFGGGGFGGSSGFGGFGGGGFGGGGAGRSF